MKAKTLWGQAFFACVVVVVWMVGLKAAETAPEPYNANIAYPKTGTLVVYTEPISTGGYKVGVFKNG
jgi:hypothetical protein